MNLAEWQERLIRTLAAFKILNTELQGLGFNGLNGEMKHGEDKVKAALYTVLIEKKEPWF